MACYELVGPETREIMVEYERAGHDPTPEEIRAKCREIQSGWSDKVEARRRAMGRRRVDTLECRIVTEDRP